MNWRLKAAIQRAVDRLPVGKQALYRQLQLRCGGLVKGYDHAFLLSEAAKMTQSLRTTGFDVEGQAIMEVGTGWRLDMPIGFYLCGARRVMTFDLNPFLDGRLALDTVRYVAAHPEKVGSIFHFVERPVLEKRIATLERVSTLTELFAATGIAYQAPYDCAATELSAGSVDLHYSYTVFEHIPASILEAILREASRLLSPRGLAFHHIDLGDHFAQVDETITPANFLRFSEKEWKRYAGTPWSYHNRLREDDYSRLFAHAGHEILAWEPHIDERSLESLKSGFPLAAEYRDKPAELLSVSLLDVISRPAERSHFSAVPRAANARWRRSG
jgi:SAM-dependent methyltransferase